MLSDKPNNDFHWKGKLEEIETLPGETFNKEVVWDKLHQRMQGKSRNKNAIWYWAAAACLILALGTPWVFLANKKESVLVKNNPAGKQNQAAASQPLQPLNTKEISVVISSQSTKKALPALSAEKGSKINSSVNHTITVSKIIRDKKEKEEFIAQKIINNAMAPVDAAISIVAILPEKKKLQVVHINELGDPVAETPNIVSSYEHRTFKVRLINQDAYTSSPPQDNTGFNIFKTKLTPN